MEIKQPKEKSAEEALQALMERCARAETCLSDARRLLARWRVPQPEWEGVLRQLVDERFVDEQRYAEAFVRDKLHFSRWGARKISEALYRKQIPREIIASAMEQVESASMGERLETDLRRKNQSIKEENPYKRREKLIRFGVSRGFDLETVLETTDHILGDPNE